MNITAEAHRAATVICITGDLTADNSDRFQRDVRETLDKFSTNVIIDCSSLGLIDSIGLESFLWLSDELSRAGNKLRFAFVPDSVNRVFEFTRLDRIFSTHESIEKAARSFT